jgi:hypothetical protein
MEDDAAESRASVANLVLAAEKERLRALVSADLPIAERLHADDYQLIPPGGMPISKADYLGAIASGAITYRVFEPASDVAIREYGSAAILRYQARIEIEVDGHHFTELVWHTDLYELQEGQWRCVWSQATRIPTARE